VRLVKCSTNHTKRKVAAPAERTVDQGSTLARFATRNRSGQRPVVGALNAIVSTKKQDNENEGVPMLHLNLPENPTIADLVAVLQKCDQTKLVTNDVYEPITAVILDPQGDAILSKLPRKTTKPAPTLTFNMPPTLISLSRLPVSP
jgi:hypothetical protein